MDTSSNPKPEPLTRMKKAARKRSGRAPLLKKLGLLCGSIVLALLAAELALRLPYFYYRQMVVRPLLAEGEKLLIVQSDVPGLYYCYEPHVDGTNSQGYFDEEHSLEKEEGVFRIVVIGDSIAAGQWVKQLEAFPQVLNRKLNESSPDRRFEVILIARSGYATSQQLILLRREAFQYDPDLILWSYCLNDPAHPVFHSAAGELARMYEPKIHLWHLAAGYRYRLKESIKARDGPQEFHRRLHYVYWEQVAEDLKTIGALCRQHEVPVVFVIHPVFQSEASFERYSLIGLHHKLTGQAIRSGLSPLDLLDAYRDYTPEELGHPDDPWHPSVKGHRVAAEYIYHRLVKDGLVPLPLPPSEEGTQQ